MRHPPGFRRLLRFYCRRWFFAALLAGIARFSLLLAVLLLVAWSYTIWGNPRSPLGHLLLPSCFLAAAGLGLNMVAKRLLRTPNRRGGSNEEETPSP